MENINNWWLRIQNKNSSFNLIIHQTRIDKIYLSAKDPYETKYQLLINKRSCTGLKNVNVSKAVYEYSNDMDDICKNIEENNLNKKQKNIDRI